MSDASGARAVGFRILRIKLEDSRSVSRMMCAVIVVPIFAPMITPIALRSLSTRALTKPTTITVVAEEDWIAAVTSAPSKAALKILLVSFSSVLSSRPPEIRSRPEPRIDIP